MQLAGGEVTVEHQRERKRKSQTATPPAPELSADDDDQLEERWHNADFGFAVDCPLADGLFFFVAEPAPTI